MPGPVDSPATPVAPLPAISQEPTFAVASQRVWLDINPLQVDHSVTGKTEITLIPSSAELKHVKLNCRQARVTKLTCSVGRAPSLHYADPYLHTSLPGQSTAHQWHMLYDRLESQLKLDIEPELVVTLPKNARLVERPPDASDADSAVLLNQTPQFYPVTVTIEFSLDKSKDGLHFVGCGGRDMRYPHVYTQAYSGSAASCIFPCVDDNSSRCPWDISISCPKTMGDALSRSGRPDTNDLPYSEEDKALDLLVVCSGELTDEIADPHDVGKKIVSFHIEDLVLPKHIGFAIGPFEQVNLAAFRESREDERLGKNATPIYGFCLAGRSHEVRNTCFPIAQAIDFFLANFGPFPYPSYNIAFVDDMIDDTSHTASFTLCSSRLLFPENIIEPLMRVTRQLAYAVAYQWIGINIIPAEPADIWVTIGLGYYMADIFLRKLAGNNEYRFMQKRAADVVFQKDVARPSLHEIGPILHLDQSQMEFMTLKSPMVMFILDRRLTKSNGTTGLVRIISKICLNNKAGDLLNGALSTAQFIRTCERVGHLKLETFFNQWVFGAGCPRFQVTQRFNKKRLVVEMQINQVQHESVDDEALDVDDFFRDVREDSAGVYAGNVQAVFTGPMTIRIHEADGTPYEHIVEIKELLTRFEIPYNTKYKRIKRTRRQKEKLAQGGAIGPSVTDGDGDVAPAMLGDVLQSEEELRDWRLAEFSKEEEDRMNSESFEWIRMDADFEWICRMQFNLPPHMYLSQLQQDRDVVAQYESIQSFVNHRENALVSSWLVRTLMDRKYFYGIRGAAATALHKHARDEVQWLGFFHLKKAFESMFCLPSGMIRPNEFSNRAQHHIQCALVRSMGLIRDNSGRSPFFVRKFLHEKLRFNDNSQNDYSDVHYLQALVRALSGAVASAPPLESDPFSAEPVEDDLIFFRACLEEIDRHKRLDEWLPSYHNLLSTEGLNARQDLMKSGLIARDPREFLQYTQAATQSDVRIAAFSSLLDLGFGADSGIMRWFLFSLSSDTSPYVRTHLMHLFGRWLGTIATGQHHREQESRDTATDGLIIEGEPAPAGRESDDARKKTVSGALAALKTELGSQEDFKADLWSATCSGVLTIPEIGSLLDVCSWLYETENRLLLTLKYPRYWRVLSGGLQSTLDGSPSLILRFSRTEKIRTKRMVKWQPPATDLNGQKPTLKRKGSAFQGNMAAPATKIVKKSPAPTGRSSSPQQGEENRKKLFLKLKVKTEQGDQPPTPGGAQTPSAQTPGGTLKLKLKPPTPGANFQ